MTYIAEIFLLIANIQMAAIHSRVFKKGGRIKHGWWGLLYVAATSLFAYLTNSWWLLLASALLRKVSFDIALNLFNGFSPFRISRETTSIIDKLHNKLFGGHAELYQTIYFLLLVAVNFFWI